MNSDLKVSFYLKKNEVDSEGMCPVMGRIRIGKTEAPFGAKTKIPLSLWDTHSGRALGKSREATELNRKLDNMNVLIHTRYKELLKTGETVNAGQLKAAFQGIAQSCSEEKQISVASLIGIRFKAPVNLDFLIFSSLHRFERPQWP